MSDSDFEEPVVLPVRKRVRGEANPPAKRQRWEPYKRKMWWFIMLDKPTHTPPEGYVNFLDLQRTITRYMHRWGYWVNYVGYTEDAWSVLNEFDSVEPGNTEPIHYTEYGWIIPNEMTVGQLNFIFRLVNECGYDARIDDRSAEDYRGTPFLQKLEHFYK